MKRTFLLFFALGVVSCLSAMTRDSICLDRHEVRIGWGDMMFETAMYHPDHYTSDYRYTGHLFATYQYRFLPWLSAGGEVDYEQVWWHKPEGKANFYNLCFIPQVRFTYYWSKYLNLYSGLGVGLLVNGGSELNFRGQKTACAPVIEITALGIQVGDDHWFGTVEIGGLNAMSSLTDFYMLASRLFSASIGYRF